MSGPRLPPPPPTREQGEDAETAAAAAASVVSHGERRSLTRCQPPVHSQDCLLLRRAAAHDNKRPPASPSAHPGAMELHVNNVSATAASVGWSPSWRCPQGWAPRAVHRPDWERPLAGTSPRRLQREERVAPGRHRVALEGLTPLTGYIACVSCAPVPPLLLAPPQQHQQQRSSQQPHLARQQPAPHGGEQGACVAFHTTGPDLGNRKKEMAIAIWVSSSVLLLLIAAFLLYGCLRIWCRRRRELGKGTVAGGATKQQQPEEQQLLPLMQQQQRQQRCHQQPEQQQQPVQEQQQLELKQEEEQQLLLTHQLLLTQQQQECQLQQQPGGLAVQEEQQLGGRAATPSPDPGRTGDPRVLTPSQARVAMVAGGSGLAE
ncbi:fibronectin type III domain-containing protein 9 [Lampetra fluviatilis]